MKKINPYKNAYLRMKRWIKEDIASSKEKFKNNPLIKKISENKKTTLIVTGFIISLIIFISILINVSKTNSNYNESLKGPIVQDLVLIDNRDLKMVYSGDIENGKIEGYGNLKFKSSSYEVTIEGTFDKINDPSTASIQIGKFSEGYITVYDPVNKIEYQWNGDFENYELKMGTLKIKKEKGYILYDGSFIDNKLNGIGIKKVYTEGKTQTITGWFENGILQEPETETDSSNKNENPITNTEPEENNNVSQEVVTEEVETPTENSTTNSEIIDFEDTFTPEQNTSTEETVEESTEETSEPIEESTEVIEESKTSQTIIDFEEPEF